MKLDAEKGMNLPRHVVMIPDGNRRWALNNHVSEEAAYAIAAERAKELISACQDLGVPIFTLWAFSTENWSRVGAEVSLITRLAAQHLGDAALFSRFKMEGGRFQHLGKKDRMPVELADLIRRLESESADNDKYIFNFAFDYGGREEILHAVSQAAEQGLDLKSLTADEFERFLYTAGQDDPDLIIRTSGEKRTSGMMPWQSCYAELHFTDVDFPDFTVQHLKEALEEFSRRKRRFGR